MTREMSELQKRSRTIVRKHKFIPEWKMGYKVLMIPVKNEELGLLWLIGIPMGKQVEMATNVS